MACLWDQELNSKWICLSCSSQHSIARMAFCQGLLTQSQNTKPCSPFQNIRRWVVHCSKMVSCCPEVKVLGAISLSMPYMDALYVEATEENGTSITSEKGYVPFHFNGVFFFKYGILLFVLTLTASYFVIFVIYNFAVGSVKPWCYFPDDIFNLIMRHDKVKNCF